MQYTIKAKVNRSTAPQKILSVSCKDFLKDVFVALLQSCARSAVRCWEHQIKKSADQPWHERGHNSMQCSEEYPTQEYKGTVFKPDAAYTLLLQMQHLVRTRVRRDPGTRPVPNFFSSTQPVPTRKLKMTGYRVIRFHFESNKTQPRMRYPANWMTNPINRST